MSETMVATGSMMDGLTLPALRMRAVSTQAALLLAAAWVLPAAAHWAGMPGRVWLPMHWPVIFAGLCYGWRSGALIGLAAPGISFLLSGMPPPVALPAMTAELAAYGFLAGLVRGKFHRNVWLSVAVALLGGRLVFLGIRLATGGLVGPFADYLRAAMLPGLPSALAQFVLLPLAAGGWVRRERRRAGADEGGLREGVSREGVDGDGPGGI